MRDIKMVLCGAAALMMAVFLPPSVYPQARPLPQGAYAKNVEFIGFSDVGRHIPFKISIHQVNGRWYMYAAGDDDRGWAILDVTHPAEPSVVNWIPGSANTNTGQVDIAEGIMITAVARARVGADSDPTKPWDEGVLIWSLANPVHPKLLGQYKTGGLGAHRSGYYGGRYMYLAAAPRGYRGYIFQIVDISDPAHPFEVSRWAPPELKLSDPDAMNTSWPIGHGLHGPPAVVGNLAYLGFHDKLVILDISDVRYPKQISELSFDPPFQFRLFAVHTTLAFPSRKIVYTNSEGGCADGPSQVSLIDVSDSAKPKVLSYFPVPELPPGAPWKNWCEKGLGAHNVNMLFHNPFVDHSDNIIYSAYGGAGLRVFDISDARFPREIGYFVLPASGASDVVVDTRGYIYLSDRRQGIWILRYTGPKPGPAIPLQVFTPNIAAPTSR